MNLKGKKILFIGIGFYDYESLILEKLKQSGAIVSYVNSCRLTLFVRILNWVKMTAMANTVKQKIRAKQIKNSTPNSHIVFVIKGQNISQNDIKTIKSMNPNAKYILYFWDSLVRHENLNLLFANFKNIYSFDQQDCKTNPVLKFRPLFYRQVPHKDDQKYTISFVGWMHSDRLQILRKVKHQLIKQNRPYFLKLYVSPMQYIWQRYLDKTITAQDKDLIITKPLSYSDFQQVICQSEMVLDIAHPLQSGLTMRTIEALAVGCHLVTSNKDIVNYPQIKLSQYTLFERDQIQIPFIDTNDNDNTLDTYFSLDHFLNELLA